MNNEKEGKEAHKIEITDDNNLSYREIRDTFYRCRDFELTNLWQRSIFLFGFIVACFTGYGTILLSLLTSGEQNVTYPTLANFIECLISLIGIVFSVIWIMMAKASKAWYEVYERAIGDVENKADKDNCKSIHIEKQYRMGYYCTLYEDDVNNSPFSTKAGQFSPSKLNVFIGQVLFVIWLLCFCGHLIVLISKSELSILIHKCTEYIYAGRYNIYPIIVIAIVYLLVIYCVFSNNSLTSTAIKKIKKTINN